MIYLTNDNLVEVQLLKNAATGSYLNSATVSAVVNSRDGTEVVASFSLSYKATSNGIYQGVVPDDSALVEGEEYDIVITADAGAGLKGTWTIRKTAGLRTS